MLDVTGDDMDHLAVIGEALMNVAQKAGAISVPAIRLRGGQQTPGWLTGSHTQGVSTPAEELDYLPLTIVDFTNNGVAAVDHADEIEAFPQRPFRGERIVLQASYIPAAAAPFDALYRLMVTPAIFCGAVQIGATQGGMPGAAFGATAFGVRLSFPAAGQGTRIYVPWMFAAIGAGDRIIVGGGIFGRAVR